MLKPDYFAHDAEYRRRRAAGKSGWTPPDEVAEAIADVDAVLQRPDAPRAGRALELGCGTGELTLHLAGRGFEAHGTDISPFALDWAKENAAGRGITACFELGSVLDLKAYPAEFFDLVVDGLCLHCIIGEDRGACLNSIRRVLKPGGLFHLRTMCGRITDPDALADYEPQTRCTVKNGIARRYIGDASDILAEIASAGFAIKWSSIIPARDDRPDTDCLLADAVKM